MNAREPRADAPPAARAASVSERAAAVARRAQSTQAFLTAPDAIRRDPELVQLHADAGRFYQACLHGSWVPGYLAARSLDAALLPSSPWKIGYAPPGWTVLTGYLRTKGYGDAALLASGLVVTGKNGLRDHFCDRLMIPLRDGGGIVTGFIGRRPPDAGDDHGPRYLNSPDTALFSKSSILAGLAEGRGAFRRGAQPVLTEGPLDAIAVSIAGAGQFAGIAPSGTALTAAQVALLARTISLRERGIRVAFDADPAAKAAAARAYSRLVPATTDLTAVTFPDGSDPASMLEKHGRHGLREALTSDVRPLADLVVDAAIDRYAHGRELVFAELQMGALRAAATAIAAMPGDHVGPQARRMCFLYAEKYGWTYEDVNREIIETIDRHYHAGIPALVMPPWAVVPRATAPPRSVAAGTPASEPGARRHLRLVHSQQSERG